MAVKKSYNRYFIIFQEEDRGFGIAIDKQPTGYTKIENRNGKCKITVYAQNLLKERGPYFCCLVDSSKDPLVVARLGSINIDEAGRGETWWEFNEDDIANTLVPFDRFNIAAVITEDKKLNAPLAGYVGKDRVDWKERMPLKAKTVEVKKTEEEIIIQPKQEIKEDINALENKEEELDEAKQFKEYEEQLLDSKVIEDNDVTDNNIEIENQTGKEDKKGDSGTRKSSEHEKKKAIKGLDLDENEKIPEDDNKSKPNKEAVKSNQIPEKLNKEENKETDLPIHEEMEEEVDREYHEERDNELGDAEEIIEYSYEDNNEDDIEGIDNPSKDRNDDLHRRPFATMFHDILEDFEEEGDLLDDIKDIRWWKIPLGDEVPIGENIYYPYYCAIYHLKMAYPYINYIKYCKKLGFYHFGIKYDSDGEVKYVLYGIEGGSAPEKQPYMGMTGFIRWMKLKHGDRGIWIMYYNPHTGCIMIPKNK